MRFERHSSAVETSLVDKAAHDDCSHGGPATNAGADRADREVKPMRQIVSTAIVAVIVGALAGATMSAVAQNEPAAERAVEPAGLNADKVDGRHAVKYTNQRGVRRGKLVATNNKGELPSNIVRPFWGLLRNTPAGFADGVDNEGVTGVTITRVATPSTSVAAGGTATDTATCPAGSKVVGGGVNGSGVGIEDSYPENDIAWFGRGTDFDGGGGAISVFAMCMSVEPGIVAAARNANVAAASSE